MAGLVGLCSVQTVTNAVVSVTRNRWLFWLLCCRLTASCTRLNRHRVNRLHYIVSFFMFPVRAQELWESRGRRPGLPVPCGPYGLCGRKATLKMRFPAFWALSWDLHSANVGHRSLTPSQVPHTKTLSSIPAFGFFVLCKMYVTAKLCNQGSHEIYNHLKNPSFFLKGFLVITGSVKDFIQPLDLFRVFRKSLKRGARNLRESHTGWEKEKDKTLRKTVLLECGHFTDLKGRVLAAADLCRLSCLDHWDSQCSPASVLIYFSSAQHCL